MSACEIAAMGVGEATITASVTLPYGGPTYTATCEVSVTKREGFEYEIGEVGWAMYDETYLCMNLPVTNTGTMPIYLGSSEYRVYDRESGESLSSGWGFQCNPNILAPGETGYYFNLTYNYGSSFGERSPDTLRIEVRPRIRLAEGAKRERYRVTIQKVGTMKGEDTIYVQMTLTNRSDEPISRPGFAVNVFDKADRFAAAFHHTAKDSIEVGAFRSCTLPLKISSYDLTYDDYGSLQIIGYDDVRPY